MKGLPGALGAPGDSALERHGRRVTILAVMQTDRGSLPGGRSWTLLLAPGPRLEECFPLLSILAETTTEELRVDVERLEEWPDLVCAFPERGRIVIDSRTIEPQQRDLLRGFLRHHPAWSVVLVGAGGDAELVAELAALPTARWCPGPLEVAQLSSWLLPPTDARTSDAPPAAAEARPSPAAADPPRRPGPDAADLQGATAPDGPGEAAGAGVPSDHGPRGEVRRGEAPPAAELPGDEDAILEEIERILAGEAEAPAASPAPRPASGAVAHAAVSLQEPALQEPALQDLSRDEDPAPTAQRPAGPAAAVHPAPAPRSEAPPRPAPPAPYFRHQVADLADLVQCVDLSLDVARRELAEAAEEPPAAVVERLGELAAEVARLRQFTRTLNFLVAPPAVGDQRFDLGPLLEEMLTARRGEPGSPRYLLRAPEPLPMRSDKLILTQALDALLFLAHHAAGPEGTVRVEARAMESPEEELEARVSIRFPAGRFRGHAPGELLEPYALRRELPELGANALAAACSLLRGQGGRAELRAEAGGEGFEWLVRLPGAR